MAERELDGSPVKIKLAGKRNERGRIIPAQKPERGLIGQ